MSEPLSTPWPKAPLIYQIYPRSFQDSDDDGIGDISGALSRLPALRDLSLDGIWLSPFMPSPWIDGGYDVSDFTSVHPTLGTFKDLKRFVDACHDDNIRVLADLVLNHTSHKHPWFERSAQRLDGYDDYYVWRDAKPDGSVPTNWIGRFGKPAWTWHHRRQQYYLHNYMSEQPSLNLRCPQVQDEIEAIIHFWREFGFDGFRLDAVTAYLCDPEFRDNPPATAEVRRRMDGEQFLPYVRQDHLYDFLPGDGAAYAEHLRRWAGPNTWFLGEVGTGNQSVSVCNDLTSPGRLDAGYVVDTAQFGLTADTVSCLLADRAGPGRLTWWVGSHDRPRQPKDPEDPIAKLHLFFLAFMPGPALVYQGEELGLPQPELHEEEVTDPYDLAFWPDGPGREGARVPLPWSSDQDGFGFTQGKPWLPMRWSSKCARSHQEANGTSTLALAKAAFHLRALLGLRDLPTHRWRRDGGCITIEYSAAVIKLNFSEKPVPSDEAGDPELASKPVVDGFIPPEAGAIWLREAARRF
ncbi:alpha-amylase family glycosyl hydrolase [uncultured Roseobacter sp.]|uniref:alpha-amylase family glycosyl hydrolase n=1 Tax=uncultured Roseobacter sp. TaxID=114847 RepID=UPI0026163AAD|nr:alpha-amylase family glycosyl hydrolase [uncultured Roseobacter sp.]